MRLSQPNARGRWVLTCALAAMTALLTARAEYRSGTDQNVRFEISAAPGLLRTPADGRLLVVVGKQPAPEPFETIGDPGTNANPVAAVDVKAFDGRQPAIVDGNAIAYPLASLSAVPAGDYVAQAILATNRDLKTIAAAGNLMSAPTPITIEAGGTGTIRLQLSRKVPDERVPPPTDQLRWVKIPSRLLSHFHQRPIFLRAGVILPRGYETEPTRRYPLRLSIGGYGASYTTPQHLMRDNTPFRKAWMADEAPRMILAHLHGDGPLGDPHQVNSANHGPYGDAITQELIPYLERKFRLIAEPRARVLDGDSTGGWASLALQIFYPDVFNGTWSFCPDSVDFRGFELVNIYEDENAYVNRRGHERPSARQTNGDVRYTLRHELQTERVMGTGDAWTMSGGQWGAWNATYAPKGADGRPVPLWDGKTGAIDRQVAEHWKKYDLRLRLQADWSTLAAKLQGKINIWMGDADNYFLNNAARMLETFFQKAQPPYQGRMVFKPMQGHCYIGLSDLEIMKEMGARTGATP